MFIERIMSLFGGKLRRWIKTRESRDPEAVYESAIADRVRRYQQLKAAAAGVIYMRSKLERDLKRKTTELVEVAEQAVQAADMNEDQCALILLRRKHELEGEVERLKEELAQLTTEAEDAKKNLVAFKDEIEKLKVEKVRMMARLRNAQARVRIQQALESLSTDEDVRSLEEVRESIQQMLAQAGVNRELHSAEVEEKMSEIRRRNAETKAQAELDDIKRRRRGLVPMDVFTHNGANGTPVGN
ncbi:MAG TPA: PspA/IM30 family protein [Candidatus Binataceae bacterium]|nr:PspA/IM30 family protein [Candidatus Binataceae bacterium]